MFSPVTRVAPRRHKRGCYAIGAVSSIDGPPFVSRLRPGRGPITGCAVAAAFECSPATRGADERAPYEGEHVRCPPCPLARRSPAPHPTDEPAHVRSILALPPAPIARDPE